MRKIVVTSELLTTLLTQGHTIQACFCDSGLPLDAVLEDVKNVYNDVGIEVVELYFSHPSFPEGSEDTQTVQYKLM